MKLTGSTKIYFRLWLFRKTSPFMLFIISINIIIYIIPTITIITTSPFLLSHHHQHHHHLHFHPYYITITTTITIPTISISTPTIPSSPSITIIFIWHLIIDSNIGHIPLASEEASRCLVRSTVMRMISSVTIAPRSVRTKQGSVSVNNWQVWLFTYKEIREDAIFCFLMVYVWIPWF